MARTEGHGKQGRSRSRAENVTALRHLAQYEQLGLSHDAAVKATALAELAISRTNSPLQSWSSNRMAPMAIITAV